MGIVHSRPTCSALTVLSVVGLILAFEAQQLALFTSFDRWLLRTPQALPDTPYRIIASRVLTYRIVYKRRGNADSLNIYKAITLTTSYSFQCY